MTPLSSLDMSLAIRDTLRAADTRASIPYILAISRLLNPESNVVMKDIPVGLRALDFNLTRRVLHKVNWDIAESTGMGPLSMIRFGISLAVTRGRPLFPISDDSSVLIADNWHNKAAGINSTIAYLAARLKRSLIDKAPDNVQDLGKLEIGTKVVMEPSFTDIELGIGEMPAIIKVGLVQPKERNIFTLQNKRLTVPDNVRFLPANEAHLINKEVLRMLKREGCLISLAGRMLNEHRNKLEL